MLPIAPWWMETTLHFSGTLLKMSCHGNYTACAYKNKSLTVHRHFDIYDAIFFFKQLSEKKTEDTRWNRGRPKVLNDERSQSPQRRACCWKRLRRRAQHCGSSAGPQAWRRCSEEAQIPEEPGGQQARHRGRPADTERTHHAGGCARTAGGYARFESLINDSCLRGPVVLIVLPMQLKSCNRFSTTCRKCYSTYSIGVK